MARDVFISYSTPNLAIADAIRSAFESAGVSCWIATDAIREGGDWAAQIPPAIATCKVFLLVLSSAASASTQVAREVHLAVQQHKRVIPYRIDADDPHGTLAYFLAGVHRVEARDDPAGRIGDLLERTRRALQEIANPSAPAIPESTSPSNLPDRAHQLVAREDDLAAIGDALRKHRLVTVVGPGGVGKTSVAIEAARTALPSFPQGVWYVELAAISDESLVSSEIRSVLPEDKTAKVLLVLDNCEHVLGLVSKTVAEALASHPNICVLATSRAALGLTLESAYTLAPLDPPRSTRGAPSLTDLNASPAARLLLERASSVGSVHLELESERMAVGRICRRLDGLPLALELAAARASTLSFAQIAGAIDQRFKLLTRGAQDAPAHHRTLAALIDWSFDLLTDREKALFLRFGAFPGRFTLDDALKSVCPDVDEFELIDIIDSLMKGSLLVVSGVVGSEKQYDLLESLRAYLRQRLEAGGDYPTLAAKVAVRGASLDGVLADRDNAVQQLNARFDNIRFALGWYGTDERDVGQAATIVTSLNDLWIESGRWLEGRHWSEMLLQKSTALPVPIVISLHLTAALVCIYIDEYETPIQHYERALELTKGSNDPRTEARILNGLATAHFNLGHFGQSYDLWKKAAELLRQENMPVQGAMVSKNLAVIDQLVHHNYDVAEKLCSEAYRILDEAKSNLHAALAMRVLCEISYARNDLEAARERGDRSLQRFQALENEQYVADGKLLLAKIELSRGNTLSSLMLLRDAMVTYSDELGRELADAALLAAGISSTCGDAFITASLLEFFRSEQQSTSLPLLEPDAHRADSIQESLNRALTQQQREAESTRGKMFRRKEVASAIQGVIASGLDKFSFDQPLPNA